MAIKQAVIPARAAWRESAWCEAAGVSTSLLRRLPPEQRPKRVRILKQTRIIEPPLDWLRRIDRINTRPAKS